MSDPILNTPTPTADHAALVHDLRLRVLSGDEPTAEEMLLIVEDIRRGRRSAERPTKASRAKSGSASAASSATAEPTKPVDLNSILDQEL